MTSGPVEANALLNARRTASVADAFHRRLCFLCLDVLNPNSTQRKEVPAHATWIGPSPKFLCLLLCQPCFQGWLVTAYTSDDAHHWPTGFWGITELPNRGG